MINFTPIPALKLNLETVDEGYQRSAAFANKMR